MPQGARWIRQGTVEPQPLVGAITGLALAQGPRALPILLWARTAFEVESDVLCAGEDCFAYAIIAPAKFAPGRASRWTAWALAPAIATYRQFGVRVYCNGPELWRNGAKIARGASLAIGDCVVASGSLLSKLPGAGFEERVIEAVFRMRLEAQLGWQFDNSWPSAGERARMADAMTEPAFR